MKLKDSTFAIIAEKQDSISHRWFKENPNTYWPNTYWYWNSGCYYQYDKGEITYFNPKANEYPDKNIPIYTESEFEALLKAEQENEAVKVEPRFDYSMETFGTENILIGKPIKFTLNEPEQITISYNLAIEYIAERLGVDKGIIKIEMP